MGEPQEQERGVSAVEHTEVEGVQVQDDLVPHQRQEAKEGRRHCRGDVQGRAAGWNQGKIVLRCIPNLFSPSILGDNTQGCDQEAPCHGHHC